LELIKRIEKSGVLVSCVPTALEPDLVNGNSPVGEGGDDAKVWPSSTNGPEKLRIGLRIGLDNGTVTKYNLGRDNSGSSSTLLASEPSEAASDRLSTDTWGRAATAIGGDSSIVQSEMNISPASAALRGHALLVRCNGDFLVVDQINKHALCVNTRVLGIEVVATASSGELGLREVDDLDSTRHLLGSGRRDNARSIEPSLNGPIKVVRDECLIKRIGVSTHQLTFIRAS